MLVVGSSCNVLFTKSNGQWLVTRPRPKKQIDYFTGHCIIQAAHLPSLGPRSSTATAWFIDQEALQYETRQDDGFSFTSRAHLNGNPFLDH